MALPGPYGNGPMGTASGLQVEVEGSQRLGPLSHGPLVPYMELLWPLFIPCGLASAWHWLYLEPGKGSRCATNQEQREKDRKSGQRVRFNSKARVTASYEMGTATAPGDYHTSGTCAQAQQKTNITVGRLLRVSVCR